MKKIYILIGIILLAFLYNFCYFQRKYTNIEKQINSIITNTIDNNYSPISYTQTISRIGGTLSRLYTIYGWDNMDGGTPFNENVGGIWWTRGGTMVAGCMQGYHMTKCEKVDNTYNTKVYVYSDDFGECRMDNEEMELARASMQIDCVKNTMTDEEALEYSKSQLVEFPVLTAEDLGRYR